MGEAKGGGVVGARRVGPDQERARARLVVLGVEDHVGGDGAGVEDGDPGGASRLGARIVLRGRVGGVAQGRPDRDL